MKIRVKTMKIHIPLIIIDGDNMKLYISQTGIVDSIESYVSDAKSDLGKARSRRLYAPSSFEYSNYINNLRTKIDKFYRELSCINNSLIKSERKYDNLFSKETRKIDSLKRAKVAERTGVQDIL